MKISFLKMTLATSCAGLVLVACGGGGSDGDNPGNTPPALSAPLAITSENAAQVSGSGVGASNSADTMNVSGSSVLGGIEMTSSESQFSFRTFAKKQLNQYRTSLNMTDTLAGVEISSTMVDCSNGGSITISGNVVDHNRDLRSRGDSLTVIFDNCGNSGTTMSGSISVTFNTDQSDELTAPYNNSMTMVMDKFSVVQPGQATLQAQGDMTIDTSSDDGITVNTSISGTSFSVGDGSATEILANYKFDFTINKATGAYNESIVATIDIRQLGGSVECTTPTLFEGVGDSNPHTGAFKCVGANQSSVTLTAIDSTTVQLEIDTDGDGVADETKTSTWAEIGL
ncbi:hypothetical protein MNBD_GAMMA16-1675 [hydrothermal vent metagenome]|uniref:Lipoprotein n=1 Tax=hydrothermal vent metagenome TaxID=652676 RepID=A0A3B0ZIE4_9ZZZZ